MNRIANAFTTARDRKKNVLIPYITPEFPVKGTTVPLILALESAGASMMEIGIPFSDPLADGPTIQHSSGVAISNGVNISVVLALVKEARTKTNIPLILMGYINPIIHYGMEKFVIDAKTSGVDGVIVPDLPPEESASFRAMCTANELSVVFLIAPTSSDERIRFIDAASTDFSYCVSITGVTGARKSLADDLGSFLQRVKKNTKKPFVVGFGIESKEQVSAIGTMANGVVVGSALIRAMQDATDSEGAVTKGTAFFHSLQ